MEMPQCLVIKFDSVYIWDGRGLRKYDEDVNLGPKELGRVAKCDEEMRRVKVTKIPVYNLSKVEIKEGLILKDYLHSLNSFQFVDSSNESVYLYTGDLEEPGFSERYDVVGGVPIKEGDKAKAISLMGLGMKFVEYAVLKYKSDDVLEEAIRFAYNFGMCNEVIKYFSMLSTWNSGVSLYAGLCYEKRGDLLTASKLLKNSPENFSRVVEKLKFKSNELIALYDIRKEPKILHTAIELFPDYHLPFFKLALYYMERGKLKEALEYVDESLKRRETLEGLITKAKILLSINRYQEAFDTINVVESRRRNGQTAFLKGLALLGLNAVSMAEREFQFACREGVVEACNRIRPSALDSLEVYTPQSLVGTRLYGYEIVDLLGSGGTGYVYKAMKGGKGFALKVFTSDVTVHEMLREASKMQELSSGTKYLVKVSGTFIDENSSDPLGYPPAIAMELMEGGDLKTVITSQDYSSLRHSSRWVEVVSIIFSKVSKGLAHLHREGYVHSDVKPSNILFTQPLPKFGNEASDSLLFERIIPKLSDLGSAIRIGVPPIQYTQVYAHPLQRFGVKADTMMDLYSLGVSLYVALTGTYPLPQWLEDEIESAVADPSKREHVMKDFYRVQLRLEYVPRELRDVTETLMKGEITAEEVSRDLDNIAHSIDLLYSQERVGIPL